jgi:hypothetical protein
VALSLKSPSLGVTQHSALWSSDFPQAAKRPPATTQATCALNIMMLTLHPFLVNFELLRADPCMCQDPCLLRFSWRRRRCHNSSRTLCNAWCLGELPVFHWVLPSRKSHISVSQHGSPPMQNLENWHPLNYISTLQAKFLLSITCNLLYIHE